MMDMMPAEYFLFFLERRRPGALGEVRVLEEDDSIVDSVDRERTGPARGNT